MRYVIVIIILFCSASVSAVQFFIKPGIKRINTGLGAFWVYQGGEVGLLYKEHHQFSLDSYFYNDVENTKYYFDSVSQKESWRDDIRHYGNVYLTYSHHWSLKEFLKVSAGLSIGFKYAEYDRNFDTTVTLLHRTEELEIVSGVPLRHEAEGRFVGFGGPRSEVEIGYRRIFLRFQVLCNIGKLENFGYYKSRDQRVREIYFDKAYKIGDIKIQQAGWHDAQGSLLFSKVKVIPEIILGFTIYL